MVHRVHTLDPVLPNLQKVDNMVTRDNLISTFATLIPNTGPCLLHKGLEVGSNLPIYFREVLMEEI